jgi:hypothetical protein
MKVKLLLALPIFSASEKSILDGTSWQKIAGLLEGGGRAQQGIRGGRMPPNEAVRNERR